MSLTTQGSRPPDLIRAGLIASSKFKAVIISNKSTTQQINDSTTQQINKSAHAIILFDGVCNFCNATVNFIIKRDKKNYFKFAPLQSEAAIAFREEGKEFPQELKTLILIENGEKYFRTTAALRICRHLSGLWPWMYGFIIVPLFIRDLLYKLIARYRYRWFGKRDTCIVPSLEMRKKFLIDRKA